MKRIIAAFDGTGQSSNQGDDRFPTNVSRFCDALSNSSTGPQQIVLYQPGIGNEDVGLGLGGMYKGAIGDGVEANLADVYAHIVRNYQPGDQLFLFGFSRGAFIARVLANIIARLGVISKKASWAIRDTMEAYKKGQQVFEAHNNKMKEKDANWVHRVDIEIVGCWDTVASLGFPESPLLNPGGVYGEFEHFDGSLLKGIKRAFHALALDECRGPFTPTMWYLPKENGVPDTCAHTNVGGGYPDLAISNLTLAWMVDRCHPLLDFDREYLTKIVKLDRQPVDWRKDLPDGEKIDENDPDLKFDLEYQGYGCGRVYDSYRYPGTWKYRTPGAYDLGVTNETMHPSVGERRAKNLEPAWKPKALKHFERMTDGVWKSVKDSKSIPEARFKVSGSFEEMLRNGVETD